jgi:hypothetical protein
LRCVLFHTIAIFTNKSGNKKGSRVYSSTS